MQPYQVMFAVMIEGRRPDLTEPRPSQELITLMTGCWHQDQADRLDGFETVVEILEELQTKLGGDPRDSREDDTRHPRRTSTPGPQGFPGASHALTTHAESMKNIATSAGNVSGAQLECKPGEQLVLYRGFLIDLPRRVK